VKGIPWGFLISDSPGRILKALWVSSVGHPGPRAQVRSGRWSCYSPYSTFLALPFARETSSDKSPPHAEAKWVGDYGFYEAVDYITDSQPQIVRSWMAHHQGMALLAITNLLCGTYFQEWFHANPKVVPLNFCCTETPLGRQTLKIFKLVQQRWKRRAISERRALC